MNKTHWKYRLLIWYAHKVLHVPIVVNFTPEHMDNLYAVGFAWSAGAAQRMRGNDMLLERTRTAETLAKTNLGGRKARRAMNRAAKKEVGRG